MQARGVRCLGLYRGQGKHIPPKSGLGSVGEGVLLGHARGRRKEGKESLTGGPNTSAGERERVRAISDAGESCARLGWPLGREREAGLLRVLSQRG